jgi:hypothetical protein
MMRLHRSFRLDHSFPAESHPCRRRWLKSLVAFIAVALLGYGGLWLYQRWDAARDYEQLIAELDEHDPGWQLADRLAARPPIPPGQNSAEVVRAIHQMIGRWPSAQLENALKDLGREPFRRLSDEQFALLDAELKKVPEALAEVHKLINLPQGRFEVDWKGADWLPGSLDRHAQMPRTVISLLQGEGRHLTHQDKYDDAAHCSIGMVNAGRSLVGDPRVIPVLVRLACQHVAVSNVERVLAQGSVPPETLRLLSECFREEAAAISPLEMLRDDRALCHACLLDIREGRLSDPEFAEELSRKPAHTYMLRSMSEMVEAVRQSPEDNLLALRGRFPSFEPRLLEMKESGPASWFGPKPRYLAALHLGLLEPAIMRVIDAIYRTKARLRCAVAALAAEAYRLKHGKWPDWPAQLVPDFLPEWSTDPIDGQPLRWLRRSDGLLIYSIGPDGKDNGGDRGPDGSRNEGIDFGFQLWDTNERSQPAAARNDGAPPGADKGID